MASVDLGGLWSIMRQRVNWNWRKISVGCGYSGQGGRDFLLQLLHVNEYKQRLPMSSGFSFAGCAYPRWLVLAVFHLYGGH